MFCLFSADLHSRLTHYEQLFNLSRIHKTDAIIIGGDLFHYTHNKEEQVKFIKNYLEDILSSINIPIIILPGNTDWPVSIRELEKIRLPNVYIIDSNKSAIIDGIQFIGYEYVIPNPFRQKHGVKRDLKEDTLTIEEDSYITNDKGNTLAIARHFFNSLTSIEEDLERLAEADAIWIAHNPPYGGNLDLMYKNIHIGSKALSRRIEKIQPKLVLSGHVHESPHMSGNWVDRIGNSICINPGQSDRFHGVLFEIDERINLKSLEHTVYGRWM